MKTIGYYLRQVRQIRKLTLLELSRKTHIKKEFLKAIEEEDWNALPEYPVVLGFIKSIAGFLEIDEQKTISLLRRDYPPKKTVTEQPKPQVKKEFSWSPKFTFFLGIFTIAIVIIGYLGIQYAAFTRPPKLEIIDPVEDQVISTSTYMVLGETEIDASVKVNNQPVVVTDEGKFETEIEVDSLTTEIVAEAVSRSGKRTVLIRKIKVEFQ